MATIGNNNIRVVQLGGTAGSGSWLMALQPNGDRLYTDTTSGTSFTVPLPLVARMIEDADADTRVQLVESGGALGGDKINFVVDGITVGSVEIIAGGITKWTLDGILDPIVYAGTPRTIAQRNAITPVAGYLVYVSDGATNEYQYYNGTAWVAIGAGGVSVNEIVTSLVALTGVAPVGAKFGVNTVTGLTYYVSGGNWVDTPNLSPFKGPYSTTSAYNDQDVTLYQNQLIKINGSRPAGTWPTPVIGTDPAEWSFIGLITVINDQISYSVGDLVYEDGTKGWRTYPTFLRVVNPITGGNAPAPSDVVDAAQRSRYRGDHGADLYQVGDLIHDGGNLYRCITADDNITFTGPFAFYSANWQIVGGGEVNVVTESQTKTGHGFVVGDVIYNDGTTWLKASAALGTSIAQAVVSQVIDVNTIKVVYSGILTATAHGKTVGEYYFLDQTVAGTTTATQPTTGIVQQIYFVKDANTLLIDISNAFTASSQIPSTVQTVDYVFADISNNPTFLVATPGDLIFNRINSGNILLNTLTGVFTLTAGKTYELESALYHSGAPDGYISYQWVDNTNVAIPGSQLAHNFSSNYPNTEGSQPIAKTIFTPSSDMQVKLRIMTVIGGTATIQNTRSYAKIIQLGSSAVAGQTTTNGGVVFGNGTALVQDATNFFYDNTNNRLGIETNSPDSKIEIQGDGFASPFNTGVILNNTGASPRSFMLSSRSDGINGARFALSDETAGAVRLVMGTNGAFGLGTEGPGSKMHLAGNANTNFFDASIRFQNTGASGRQWNVGSRGDAGGGNQRFSITDETGNYEILGIDDNARVFVGEIVGNTMIPGLGNAKMNLRTAAGHTLNLRGQPNDTNIMNVYAGVTGDITYAAFLYRLRGYWNYARKNPSRGCKRCLQPNIR